MYLTCWQGASWEQIIILAFGVEFFLGFLYEKYIFFKKVLLKFQIFFLLFSLPAYYNIFDAFLFLSFYINLSESKFELWSCERNICIVTPLNLTVFEKWVRNMVLMSIFWDIFPKQITVDVSPFILWVFFFFLIRLLILLKTNAWKYIWSQT